MTANADPADGGREPVSADTRHAQLAAGLYHQYRDIVLSMDRRGSFIWDASGAESEMNWMEGRGTRDE